MEKSFFLFCFTEKKPNDTLRTKFSTQAEYYQQLFFLMAKSQHAVSTLGELRKGGINTTHCTYLPKED